MRRFILFGVLAAAIGYAADTPVAGKWQVQQSIAGNDSSMTCTFTQTGDDLAGACDSERGKMTIAGKVKDKTITWSYKSEYNGTPLTVNYSGTLAGDKISGTVGVPEFNVDGQFQATSVK